MKNVQMLFVSFLFFLVSVNISALELKPIQTCTPGTVEYKPEGSCDTTSRKCCGGSGLLGFWSEWGEECEEYTPTSCPLPKPSTSQTCKLKNGVEGTLLGVLVSAIRLAPADKFLRRVPVNVAHTDVIGFPVEPIAPIVIVQHQLCL